MSLKLCRIAVSNFRNFRRLDLKVRDSIVIVGENQTGKSNLIHALRLLLDPSLPDTARQLRLEDFCDSLPRPLAASDRIEVSVEIADFMDDLALAAILSDALIDPDQGIARLTYRFEPRSDLARSPTKASDYDFRLFAGEDPENKFRFDSRRRIPLDVFPALRDAEGVLANWKTSPLRPLLEEVGEQVPQALLESVAGQVEAATAALTENADVATLANRIASRLRSLAGNTHVPDTQLGFAPTRSTSLIRSLRLFVEGRTRGVSEASLGTANLIFLALRQLDLDRSSASGERDHTFLAIEEPEAHLHPHLQRLVYRAFLNPRLHLPQSSPSSLGSQGSIALPVDQAEIQTEQAFTRILTTHSPHIVSVTPLRSLVVLRRDPDTGISTGVSTATMALSTHDERDLERYLDVTRGELVFARAVLFVEGEAESYLVPAIAAALGIDLDKKGVSVCAVGGVHFLPYLRLTGPGGLDIRTGVLTDGDLDKDGSSLGRHRAVALFGNAKQWDSNVQACPPTDDPQFATAMKTRGIFVGSETLEIDLFREGQQVPLLNSLQTLTTNGATRTRAEAWLGNPATLDSETLMKDIKAIGKGRFAQHLASQLLPQGFPGYIVDALQFVIS